MCNPSAGEEETGAAVPGAHWLSSPAESKRFRFSEHPALQNIKVESDRGRRHQPLASAYVQAHMHTVHTLIWTSIYAAYNAHNGGGAHL